MLFDCKTFTLIFIWALNNNFPSFASVKRVGLLEVVIGLGSLNTKEFGEGGWDVLWIESVLSGDVEVNEVALEDSVGCGVEDRDEDTAESVGDHETDSEWCVDLSHLWH